MHIGITSLIVLNSDYLIYPNDNKKIKVYPSGGDLEAAMAIFTSRKQKKDVKVTFQNGMLYVEIDGGKQQAFPLAWFPKLQGGSEDDRTDWTLTATGIRWNKLNEEIAITGL